MSAEVVDPAELGELEALTGDVEPVGLLLADGQYPVVIRRLKTREFFRLVKILTTGAGPALSTLTLAEDSDEFVMQLVSAVVIAIPNAERDYVTFVQTMVELDEGRVEALAPEPMLREQQLIQIRAELMEYLENAELEDTVEIVATIVRQEADDVRSLGNRLMAMFGVAEKTGQLKPAGETSTPTEVSPPGKPSKPSKSKSGPTSTRKTSSRSRPASGTSSSGATPSSEAGPEPSTSSSESTAGAMSGSLT